MAGAVSDLDGLEGDLAEVKLRRVTFSVRRVGRNHGGNASEHARIGHEVCAI